MSDSDYKKKYKTWLELSHLGCCWQPERCSGGHWLRPAPLLSAGFPVCQSSPAESVSIKATSRDRRSRAATWWHYTCISITEAVPCVSGEKQLLKGAKGSFNLVCTVLFLFSEVVSTEYMGIVLVKQSSQTRLEKGRCWIVSWGSHTPCFLISVPPIKTELMCLLLGIIRPQQICWKSEQKDKKGLSFGELSLSERLMYSPSNPIFF